MGNKIIRQWKTPPEYYSINADQVHVWRIDWDPQEKNLDQFIKLLSIKEAHQASKFYFEADRIRYIVMRSSLRRLLGKYLEVAPADLEIAYSHHGKPYLVNLDIHKKINFNISHADRLGLIAIAMDRRVGVDLELVRQEDSIEAISQRFFTPEESKQIMSLPASLQPEAFFTCWTRKEAFIKARGEGLSIPLDQFEVSIYPKDDPKLLIIKNNPVELGRWLMFHLEPGDDYVGALVVDGKNLDVIGWEMPITSNPRY